MRVLLVAILALSCPMAAAAQSRAAPAPLPVLPPIGLPLAPIGLPLAPIGLPPATATSADGHGSAPPHFRGTRGDRRHDRHARPGFVYVVPGYGWPLPVYAEPVFDTVVSTADLAPAPPMDAFGRLHLEIEAAGPVQVIVDGYYAGTLAELNDELELEPGPHRVEFRAAGYETAAVDVRIVASKSISYRASLMPTNATTATPETTAPRSTIYFIPGCYLGNVHPSEVSLPATCDLTQLVIRRP
jgi:hypothetical protein